MYFSTTIAFIRKGTPTVIKCKCSRDRSLFTARGWETAPKRNVNLIECTGTGTFTSHAQARLRLAFALVAYEVQSISKMKLI